jgi:hypothetical protein
VGVKRKKKPSGSRCRVVGWWGTNDTCTGIPVPYTACHETPPFGDLILLATPHLCTGTGVCVCVCVCVCARACVLWHRCVYSLFSPPLSHAHSLSLSHASRAHSIP